MRLSLVSLAIPAVWFSLLWICDTCEYRRRKFELEIEIRTIKQCNGRGSAAAQPYRSATED